MSARGCPSDVDAWLDCLLGDEIEKYRQDFRAADTLPPPSSDRSIACGECGHSWPYSYAEDHATYCVRNMDQE
jgi:hypothetical protein